MARPRSTKAHASVIQATLALVASRGIDATSMDAVAAASGVSKATIYKHWPNKDALVLEALGHLHGRDDPMPDADSGDVRTDILAVLMHEPPARYAELRAQCMPHLMGYAARNPAFGQAWRSRVFEPPRLHLTRVLERATKRGILPTSLDVDVALAMLLGPVTYAHILKLNHRQTPTNLRTEVVDAFLRSYQVEEARPGRPRRTRPVRA